MSAFGLLARAKAAGMTLAADADGLLWEADRDPPDELLAELAEHKGELLRLLGSRDVRLEAKAADTARRARAATAAPPADAEEAAFAAAERAAIMGDGEDATLIREPTRDAPEPDLSALSPSVYAAFTSCPDGSVEVRHRQPDGSWSAPTLLPAPGTTRGAA